MREVNLNLEATFFPLAIADFKVTMVVVVGDNKPSRVFRDLIGLIGLRRKKITSLRRRASGKNCELLMEAPEE